MGSGERCKLPSGVWGGAPVASDFGEFILKRKHLVLYRLNHYFLTFFDNSNIELFRYSQVKFIKSLNSAINYSRVQSEVKRCRGT